MSESNAFNSNRVADSDPSDVFELDIPARPIPLRMEYGVIRDLHADADPDEESLGLLLGSLSPEALCIRCCEVLRLGHLTKSDPKALHGALREFINARRHNVFKGAEHLAGFFRTQSAGWPEMLESDREIARRYFKGSGSLFLLIRTPGHRPWSATLFELDESGAPVSHAPTLEFPFDEYLLRNGYSTDLIEAPNPAGFLVPPNPARGTKPQWIIAGSVIAILLAGSAAYKWYRPAGRMEVEERSTPAPGPLKLRVARSGKDFEISWDRLSAQVQQASSGLLTIHDGALTRAVSLDGPQLREGQILYTPLFEELNFRLEVGTTDQGVAAESVQVLAWSGKRTPEALTVAPSLPAPDNTRRLAAGDFPRPSPAAPETRFPALPIQRFESLRNDAGTTVPSVATNGTQTPSGKEAPSPNPSPLPESPKVIPASSNPAPAMASEKSSPAVVTERPPVTQRPLPVPLNMPAAQPPAAASPKPEPPAVSPANPVAPPASPPPAPAVAIATTTAPAPPTPLVSSSGVLPVPLQRVSPTLPRSVAPKTATLTQRLVSVRVMVDSTGKVRGAEVVSSTPKGMFGEGIVHAAALDAAKQWTFRPGQLNGRNVNAEYTIDFNFQ